MLKSVAVAAQLSFYDYWTPLTLRYVLGPGMHTTAPCSVAGGETTCRWQSLK